MCIRTIFSVLKHFIKKLFVSHETVIESILRVDLTEFNLSSGVLCKIKKAINGKLNLLFASKLLFRQHAL